MKGAERGRLEGAEEGVAANGPVASIDRSDIYQCHNWRL